MIGVNVDTSARGTRDPKDGPRERKIGGCVGSGGGRRGGNVVEARSESGSSVFDLPRFRRRTGACLSSASVIRRGWNCSLPPLVSVLGSRVPSLPEARTSPVDCVRARFRAR